jgi:hypothetical protein
LRATMNWFAQFLATDTASTRVGALIWSVRKSAALLTFAWKPILGASLGATLDAASAACWLAGSRASLVADERMTAGAVVVGVFLGSLLVGGVGAMRIVTALT